MSSSTQNRLRGIPVRVIGAPPAAPAAGPQEAVYHRRRRIVQLLALALIILIPLSGLFRIDAIAGAMVVLDLSLIHI